MTKYKRKILEIINSSYNHLHASEVFDELRKEYPDVVLATVYNNLNTLVEEKLINKVSIEGEIDRYDRMEKHDHLVCTKCGKIMDIKFSDLTAKLEKEAGIKIEGYDLKAFILCDECKKEIIK